MRTIVLLVFLCVCMNSFGEVYKVHDSEENCELYLSTTSILIDDYKIEDLKKVSSMPALVFRKYKGEIDLKGLWAFTTLLDDLDIADEEFDFVMSNTFHSICVSSDKRIIHSERGRRLFNSNNNLDLED